MPAVPARLVTMLAVCAATTSVALPACSLHKQPAPIEVPPPAWFEPPTARVDEPLPLKTPLPLKSPLPSAEPSALLMHDDGEDPVTLERRIKLRDAQPKPRFAEPLAPRHETRAIALLYHSIDHGNTPRTVWPWDFEAQILRLRESHVEIIHLSQLVAFVEGKIELLPAQVAVVTIDDGEASFMKYGWPVVRKHRVPFTIGVITKATSLAQYVPALDWAQLRLMVDSGLCELASHGHSHLAVTRLQGAQLTEELVHSRELIERHTGFSPKAFMYPLGALNRKAMAAVRGAGYRAAFTAVGRLIDDKVDLFRIPRFKMERTTSLQAFALFFEPGREAP